MQTPCITGKWGLIVHVGDTAPPKACGKENSPKMETSELSKYPSPYTLLCHCPGKYPFTDHLYLWKTHENTNSGKTSRVMEYSRSEEVLVVTPGNLTPTTPLGPGCSKLELVEKAGQPRTGTHVAGNSKAPFKSETHRCLCSLTGLFSFQDKEAGI